MGNCVKLEMMHALCGHCGVFHSLWLLDRGIIADIQLPFDPFILFEVCKLCQYV